MYTTRLALNFPSRKNKNDTCMDGDAHVLFKNLARFLHMDWVVRGTREAALKVLIHQRLRWHLVRVQLNPALIANGNPTLRA